MSTFMYQQRITAFFLLFLAFVPVANSEREAPPGEEGKRPQWRIGIIYQEEALVIAEIQRIAAECSKTTDVDVTPLLTMYSRTDRQLLHFVILDQIAELGQLAAIKDYPEPLAQFATLMEEDKASAMIYFQKLEDYILKSRLQAWVVMREGPEAAPESRQAKVSEWRHRLEDEMEGMSPNDRASFLFKNLLEWESPLAYEACFTLTKRMYQAQPDLVVNKLKEALLSHVPREDPPPPYAREHVVFREFCFLTMIIGDPRLIEPLESTASSPNEYVKYEADTALKWLKQNVVYPWEYEDAASAYSYCG